MLQIEKSGDLEALRMTPGVAVILYTLDESGLLDKIGIVTEKNSFFPGGVYKSVVTGKVEESDESFLERAVQETLEETGFLVENDECWMYLGEIYTSKFISSPLYCYSADVTGLTASKPFGDSSEAENGIEFEMMSLDKVKNIPDALLQSLFMKLFLKLYKNFF
jgi:8-oxo-dGTP pyrophosphatase MutT (NUDIX family)